jgi:hypothetical protein
MLSADELYDIYQKKRSYFSQQLSIENHEVIQGKILRCLYSVDLAVLTLEELTEHLPKFIDYLKDESESAQQAHEKMVETLENSISLVEVMTNEDMRASQLSLIEAMAKSHNQAQLIRCTVSDLNSQLIQLSLEASFSSLTILLQSSNADHILAALQKLVFNIIGLIPGGGIIPGAYDVYSILSARRKRTKAANDYLAHLDEFFQMVYTWCVSTQLLIDLINNLGDLEKIEFSLSYEESSITVSERFNMLVAPKE